MPKGEPRSSNDGVETEPSTLTSLPGALLLPAVLTHQEAPACALALQAAILQQPHGFAGPVLLDASALKQFDSSTLAVMLAARRAALDRGASLVVAGLPSRLRQLAGLYGVETLIPPHQAA